MQKAHCILGVWQEKKKEPLVTFHLKMHSCREEVIWKEHKVVSGHFRTSELKANTY